uniref:Uncharacterized protein n=1 Tax=Physcomitrium patens TaxID=3218 RepID=A0A2K1KDC2_PHYPA|nr:hypothetical protein PHYPA_010937 [Physcomitrium patens]
MGPNRKLRQSFVWEDEMVEVRELFKRVDRVRQSGFTGISTWKSRIPSAGTLSQNRLQRRRALCSVELSHLNYQEAPFESLNHLQNIRGMCARIKRQVLQFIPKPLIEIL